MKVKLDSKDLVPSVKLRLLVKWINQIDRERGTQGTEVQDDLTKMADAFEKVGL